MKVLLLYDVDGLGRQGEEVTVRDGYARNYLIPKGLACRPHPGAQKELALIRRRQSRIEQELISKAEAVKSALEGLGGIELELRANEDGILFGSVTPSMVVEALREKNLKLDAKQVHIPEPIKALGDHEIEIRLHPNIDVPLKVKVTPTREVKPVAGSETQGESLSPGTPTPDA